MDERAQRWNRFISDICMRDAAALSDLQRQAFICFWYDAEIQNGGHCAYFDSERYASPAETEAALRLIGGDAIADNFRKSAETGASSDWEETDSAYFAFLPSLSDLLTDHVALHADEILNR